MAVVSALSIGLFCSCIPNGMALLTSWLTATALIPDTVVIINRSAESTDYMPLYTAILVAAVAVVGTLVQWRIAGRAVEVQRELAEKTICAREE
jgi:hypothetical protein